MIDKVIPRKLDTSLDARHRSKDTMFFAKNISIGDDFFSAGEESGGNVNVIKPKRGNSEATVPSDIFTDNAAVRRVIGSVTDTRFNVVYFFLFSQEASEQGVYAFDPDDVLPGGTEVKKIFTSAQFNFPENGFVKADIVHTSNFEFGMLYFTDNVNEPRRLDIRRALGTEVASYDAASIDIKDFITACPKTPLHPIRFVFANDPLRDVSNFEGTNGFQFAYQCLYKTGEESAISTYSDIAVPPAYVEQGVALSSNIQQNKVCKLTIPITDLTTTVFTKEIEKVRILVRSGDSGPFFAIDEVDVPANSGAVSYNFYNDRVLTGVPEEDQQKYFDALPKKAKTQSVVNNRLFYGNYVEGFDEPQVSATLTVQYSEREAEFTNIEVPITPIVLVSGAEYTDLGISTDWASELNYTPNRRAGYKIDTTNIPASIEAGSILNLSISVTPDKNFHVYNTESFAVGDAIGPATHHLTKEFFGQPENATLNQKIHHYDPEGNGSHHLTWGSMFGSAGLETEDGETLSAVDPGSPSNNRDVVTGSCASNPYIIPGGGLVFSASVAFNETVNSNTQATVRDLIKSVMTGVDPGGQFTVLSSDITPSYNFNLGLGNVDSINVHTGSEDYRKNLIFAVKEKENSWGSLSSFSPSNGYFILNSGLVSFKFEAEEGPSAIDGEENNVFLYLSINSLDVYTLRTCVPRLYSILQPGGGATGVNLHTALIEKWDVYSSEYMTENDVDFSYASTNNWFFLTSNQSDTTVSQLQVLPQTERQTLSRRVLNNVNSIKFDKCSIVDGKSYLFNESAVISATQFQGDQWNVIYFANTRIASGSISVNQLLFSSIRAKNLLDFVSSSDFISDGVTYVGAEAYQVADSINHQLLGANGTLADQISPGVKGLSNTALSFGVQYGSLPQYVYDDNGNLTGGYESASAVEINENVFYISDASNENLNRSFKSKANHDFGIVYYDERGRSGVVNYLGSAYVRGYSDVERGAGVGKGKANVLINLDHDPPEWAHHYQIVYSGNTTVSDFIQYTVGGAFVASAGSGESEDGNIYVSLNYLQNHKTASYSHGFGASNPEGGDDLYVFKKGDRLRIICYFTNDDTRIYPNAYEFEIVDSVVLSDSVDENPLYVDGEGGNNTTVPAAKTGQFLVVRNNNLATGFTYSEVASGNSVNSSTHKWGDRCVVEIYTPKKSTDTDDKVYYEIGNTYNVVRDEQGNLVHQTNSILITNGDVWWRRVAMNMPFYNSNGFFSNIIQTESSQPRFLNFYAESKTFSDVVQGADVGPWGKIKIIDQRAREVRRDSSITYSDLNNYSTSLVRFTSFNPAKLQYKDTPNEYGEITSLLNYSDSLFCIQTDKTSALPVERNLISDAIGGDSLITSNEVLGTQRFYAGDYGCDHQESVVKTGNNVYYVSKVNQEVYRFNPENGVYVISDIGMKSYFRTNLNDSTINRIVGGYDPLNDEYILSWSNRAKLTPVNVIVYGQPAVDLFVSNGDGGVAPGEGDGTTGTGGGGGTGGEGVDEGDGTTGTGGGGDTFDPANPPEGFVIYEDADGDGIPDDWFKPDSLTPAGLFLDDDDDGISKPTLDSQGNPVSLFTSSEVQEEIQEAVDARNNEIINAISNTFPEYNLGNFDTVNEALTRLSEIVDNIQSGSETALAELNTLVGGIYNDLGLLFIDLLFQIKDENGNFIITENTLPDGPLRSIIVGIQSGSENGPQNLLEAYLANTALIDGSLVENLGSIIQDTINKLANAIDGDPLEEFVSLSFDPDSVVSTLDLRNVITNNLVRIVNGQKVIGQGPSGQPDDYLYEIEEDENGQEFFTDEIGIIYNVNGPTREAFFLDYNQDGLIGASDLLALLSNFGSDYENDGSADIITQQ